MPEFASTVAASVTEQVSNGSSQRVHTCCRKVAPLFSSERSSALSGAGLLALAAAWAVSSFASICATLADSRNVLLRAACAPPSPAMLPSDCWQASTLSTSTECAVGYVPASRMHRRSGPQSQFGSVGRRLTVSWTAPACASCTDC